MSTRHKHRWQRLSDVALFCECGQTKDVAPPEPRRLACTCLSVGPNLIPGTVNCPRHGNWTYTGTWT